MHLFKFIRNFLRQFTPLDKLCYLTGFRSKNLPTNLPNPNLSETRQENTPLLRQVKSPQNRDDKDKGDGRGATIAASRNELNAGRNVGNCPYCSGKNFIKSGKRRKKYEEQQRYFCNDCKRFFVPQLVKGKSFPLKLILEGLSHYNTGFTMVETCTYLKEKFGLEVKDSTLSDWTKEFEPICRYSRLRPYGLKLFSPNQVIQTVHLYHHQVYDFSVHRGKLALLLQEYKNNKFDNLREFLEAIQSECPHQFFQEGLRASELKVDFSLEEVIIREKQNFANRIAGLVLQAVSDNKLRHRSLQDFMLRNDSVTVAVEVPLYIDQMDIEHMEKELGFRIPIKLGNNGTGGGSTPVSTSASVITGHIDILQLRNGAVHILDYKPQERDKRRIKPVTQLTLYALMLSRLTGLRLYDFKCAWFDENSYFEFFPLHVVYKLRQRAKKEHPDQIKFDIADRPAADIFSEVSEQSPHEEPKGR